MTGRLPGKVLQQYCIGLTSSYFRTHVRKNMPLNAHIQVLDSQAEGKMKKLRASKTGKELEDFHSRGVPQHCRAMTHLYGWLQHS